MEKWIKIILAIAFVMGVVFLRFYIQGVNRVYFSGAVLDMSRLAFQCGDPEKNELCINTEVGNYSSNFAHIKERDTIFEVHYKDERMNNLPMVTFADYPYEKELRQFTCILIEYGDDYYKLINCMLAN